MTREEVAALVYGNPEAAVELIPQLVASVERLTKQVEELERKVALLTRDSSNSSKPPSSDGPAGKPKARPPKKSRKRKPGGQPGHKGSNRDLIPLENVDRYIPVFPETCDHCGADLDIEGLTGKHWRRRVFDIPKPKKEVTEYRFECIRCSCGTQNWAKVPEEARSGFGPGLTAFLAHLKGLHRVTRRGCQEIVKTDLRSRHMSWIRLQASSGGLRITCRRACRGKGRFIGTAGPQRRRDRLEDPRTRALALGLCRPCRVILPCGRVKGIKGSQRDLGGCTKASFVRTCIRRTKCITVALLSSVGPTSSGGIKGIKHACKQ